MITNKGLTVTKIDRPNSSERMWVVTKDGVEIGSVFCYKQTRSYYHPFKVFRMPKSEGVMAEHVGFVWSRKAGAKWYPGDLFDAMIAADQVRAGKMNIVVVEGELADAANLLVA